MDTPIAGRLFGTGIAFLAVLFIYDASVWASAGVALIVYAILTIVDIITDEDQWVEPR